MSQESEPVSGKKHRVIHWNPEAGKEAAAKRWTVGRIAGWTVGGFLGLLLLAAATTRTIRFFNPDAFTSGGTAAAVADDPNAAFMNESQAQAMHEQSAATLAALKRLPNDQPQLVSELVLIEKDFLQAELVLRAKRYSQAVTAFTGLNRRMDEFGQSVKAKQESQTLYDSILVKIRDLEIGRSLAPQELEAAITSANNARSYRINGSFLLAKRTLDEGFAHLAIVQAAIDNHITSNLTRGQQALLRGEKNAAAEAFRAVLDKSPGNEAAVVGLRRADTIDRVFALLMQGADLERRELFAEAADAYRRAFQLDGLSAAAQQGQSRALKMDEEKRFNTAWSAAQVAYARRDWPAVMVNGREALEVRPQDAEVRSMLQSAGDEAHKDAVAESLVRADNYARQYQWEEARSGYDATLKLEPSHAAALEGYIQAGNMIRTLIDYNRLIDYAEDLANQGEFQYAITQWNNAMAKKPLYLVPDDRVTKLSETLKTQNQPVSITLQSDGDTSVSVIGAPNQNPGKFKAKTIELFPGNYEVVGTRRGYRDVKVPLRVRAGVPIGVVNVICTVSVRG